MILGQSGFLVPNGAMVVELLVLCGLSLGIWALVDVLRTPEPAFRAVGRSKSTWVTLLVVLLVLAGPLGLAAATYYLVAVRPRLKGRSTTST